ncbi:MAG: hypothetical protein R3C61_00705 [Bacteroidia bacterium]
MGDQSPKPPVAPVVQLARLRLLRRYGFANCSTSAPAQWKARKGLP